MTLSAISVPQKRTPRAAANSCTPHLTSSSKPLKNPTLVRRCYPYQTLFWGEALAPMEGAYLDKQEDSGLEAKTKLPPTPPPPHKPTKPSTIHSTGPARWPRFRLSLRLPAPPPPPAYAHLSPIHTCHPRHRAPRPLGAPPVPSPQKLTEGDGRQRSSRGCHHGCGGRAGGRPNLS